MGDDRDQVEVHVPQVIEKGKCQEQDRERHGEPSGEGERRTRAFHNQKPPGQRQKSRQDALFRPERQSAQERRKRQRGRGVWPVSQDKDRRRQGGQAERGSVHVDVKRRRLERRRIEREKTENEKADKRAPSGEDPGDRTEKEEDRDELGGQESGDRVPED